MPRGGHSNSATLLHVFKEILKLDEDSDPIRALAQRGFTDMPSFLSIPVDMFHDFVLQESIEQMVEGQVQKVLVCKRLKKNHIGLMQSLTKWHCHLMAQSGKVLTNDEWYAVDQDSFIGFWISNPISCKSLPVAPSSFSFPSVHAAVTPKCHHPHLSALGGESSKPIQEVVITQTALKGEPSTLKMVMMPISSLEDPIPLKMVMMPISSLEDPIESTHLSETCEDSKLQEHEDKSAPASKRNTNQPLVDCRTLNRGSVLDGSSHFEGINMITCTIDAHQGNNNLHKMDIPHATMGSIIIIIIKHCAILAIIHQHCYHPPVGISTHCKIPFKWSKDSATILAMTCL